MPSQVIRDAVLQALVVLAILFLVFIFSRRKITGFLKDVGLYQPSFRCVSIGLGFGILMGLTTFIHLQFSSLRHLIYISENPAMRFYQMGFSVPAVFALLIHAGIAAGFSEELLFRGFFAKRFIKWWGFRWGNIVQAVLFGLFHLLIFSLIGITLDIPVILFLVFFPTLFGWFFGYLNEELGNGSILPSWFSHGIGNSISYAIIAYL